MTTSIPLRKDFSAAQLRKLAESAENRLQARRMLVIAEIYDGATRTKAGEVGNVDLQTIRNWVSCFNAGGPAGLLRASGRPAKLDESHRKAIASFIERGPSKTLRLIDLQRW